MTDDDADYRVMQVAMASRCKVSLVVYFPMSGRRYELFNYDPVRKAARISASPGLSISPPPDVEDCVVLSNN